MVWGVKYWKEEKPMKHTILWKLDQPLNIEGFSNSHTNFLNINEGDYWVTDWGANKHCTWKGIKWLQNPLNIHAPIPISFICFVREKNRDIWISHFYKKHPFDTPYLSLFLSHLITYLYYWITFKGFLDSDRRSNVTRSLSNLL